MGVSLSQLQKMATSKKKRVDQEIGDEIEDEMDYDSNDGEESDDEDDDEMQGVNLYIILCLLLFCVRFRACSFKNLFVPGLVRPGLFVLHECTLLS